MACGMWHMMRVAHELFFCEVVGKKWWGFYGISLFFNGRLPLVLYAKDDSAAG